MNSDLDASENEGKPKETRQIQNTHFVTPSPIPAETLKNFIALSDSIQHYAIQNQRIFEQLANTTVISESLNANLMATASKIIDTQRRLVNSNKLLSSPTFELTNIVNQSIERLLAMDTERINRIFYQIDSHSKIWEEQQRILGGLWKSLQPYEVVWQSHFVDISKFAILSQTLLSRISLEQMGNAFEIQDATRNDLRSVFADFMQSYSGLFDSLENQPSIIVSLPPVISKIPAVEFFNAATLVDATIISVDEDSEFENELQQTTSETRRETGDRLEALLTELNEDLITPLQGARQSIISTNPDRIRHFASSLRELFTQVLHKLSPDDKVKDWSNKPEYYDKGRPTRRARLLFICQSINQDPFSAFIDKDIDAVLEFLNLFQQGTHEVNPKFTDLQLNIMLVRMESALRFLLEIWKAS